MLIADTAGRLHTQDDLMAELTKVRRVIDRRLPGAPQTHVVLGYSLPALAGEHHAGVVAAALLARNGGAVFSTSSGA